MNKYDAGSKGRYIDSLLAKRGGKERLVRELTARNDMMKANRVVYSTEGRVDTKCRVANPIQGRYIGECRVSEDVRPAERTETSGRTSFWGKGRSSQAAYARVMGESKSVK